jgi:hypothetical protein
VVREGFAELISAGDAEFLVDVFPRGHMALVDGGLSFSSLNHI